MKKYIHKLLLVSILLLPTSAYSVSVWSGWYPMNEVFIINNGNLYLSLKPLSAHPNPGACSSTSWLRVPLGDGFKQEVYKMAVTAQASGMKVNIRVNGCDGSYPAVIQMRSAYK